MSLARSMPEMDEHAEIIKRGRALLATLDYAKPLQVDTEMFELVDLIKRSGARSYLEIGARYGGSFERIMMAMGKGARGVLIDFPGGNFGDNNSAPILLSAVSRLRRNGLKVDDVIFGPSSAPEVLERAKALAPFDAIFIDADHSYEAVRRDFFMYAPLGRMVILHDIAAPVGTQSKTGRLVEVPRFWQEIKGRYRHEEIIAPDTNMGIGVIWR